MPTSKYLNGVGDVNWHLGCAPSAAANIVIYWDTTGYSNLITSNQTNNDVIAELAEKIGTDPIDNGTPPN